MDLSQWNDVYDQAMHELERRLAEHCRLIPPSKIPEIIRAVHKAGTVSLNEGEYDRIVVKHTVYEKYEVPFLEFLAYIENDQFIFEINPLPKEEKDDGEGQGQPDTDNGAT